MKLHLFPNLHKVFVVKQPFGSSYYLIVALLLIYSCKEPHNHTQSKFTDTKIFPLSPYDGSFGQRGYKVFILENNIEDTGILKKKLRQFIETNDIEKLEMQNYYKVQYDFYKQSKYLDTTFKENKHNSLFSHKADLIAKLFYEGSQIQGFDIYRDGETFFINYNLGKEVRTINNNNN